MLSYNGFNKIHNFIIDIFQVVHNANDIGKKLKLTNYSEEVRRTLFKHVVWSYKCEGLVSILWV